VVQASVRRLEPFAQLGTTLWTTGWVRSALTLRPVTLSGDPIPWMTYPFISFMEDREALLPDLSCFEWGCGNSTRWWARRAKVVHAVEHDPRWARIIQGQLPSAAAVIVAETSSAEYVSAIGRSGHGYDIVIVDGRQRAACLKESLVHLTEAGVVVLDNSYREQYQSAIACLVAHGFQRLDFRGFSPGAGRVGQTSLFYRDGNCLGV